MESKEKPDRDRFRKRRVEQALYQEMYEAHLKFREASARALELSKNLDEMPIADSNLSFRQAHSETQAAYEAWKLSLARWKAFVAHGIVPEDLQSLED